MARTKIKKCHPLEPFIYQGIIENYLAQFLHPTMNITSFQSSSPLSTHIILKKLAAAAIYISENSKKYSNCKSINTAHVARNHHHLQLQLLALVPPTLLLI